MSDRRKGNIDAYNAEGVKRMFGLVQVSETTAEVTNDARPEKVKVSAFDGYEQYVARVCNTPGARLY